MKSCKDAILLLNTGTRNNLGDRAMLLNVARVIRTKQPTLTIFVDSGTPKWLIDEFNLTPLPTYNNCLGRLNYLIPKSLLNKSYHEIILNLYAPFLYLIMRFFLISRLYNFFPASMEKELMNAITLSRTVWFVGGGYLTDDGMREARATLYTALLANYAGSQIVMTGQGLGPFSSRFSLWMLKRVARKAKLITLREHRQGPAILQTMNISSQNWCLGVDDASSLPVSANIPSKTATLALHFRDSSFHQDAEKVRIQFESLINRLVSEGHFIKLFCFHEATKNELSTYNNWLSLFKGCKQISIIKSSDPRIIRRELQTCQVAIGMAYHFILFALLSGKPSLAISTGKYYRAKFLGIENLLDIANLQIEATNATTRYLLGFVMDNLTDESRIKSNHLTTQEIIIEQKCNEQILNTLKVALA